MKRLFSVFVFLFVGLLLSACSRNTMYILTWGEYLDPDLVEEFEKLHNVRVKVDPVESNDLMYTKLTSPTVKYDIAMPSDYLIEKLHKEDLLLELNMDLLPNYQEERFDEELIALRSQYFKGNEKYNVPYFFGSLGIMYNKSNPNIEELIKTHEWAVLFERDLLGPDIKVGMYDSSRDAYAVATMYLDLDMNTTNEKDLNNIQAALTKMDYDMYGTDDLKRKIGEGNLDIALVYSGDFFDEVQIALEDGIEIDDLTFDIHVPNHNNLWFDALVIPKAATKVDLAHEFINFIIDTENALENALYVGYTPVITEVFELMKEDEDYKEIIEKFVFYPIPDKATFKGDIFKDLGPAIDKRLEQIFQSSK